MARCRPNRTTVGRRNAAGRRRLPTRVVLLSACSVAVAVAAASSVEPSPSSPLRPPPLRLSRWPWSSSRTDPDDGSGLPPSSAAGEGTAAPPEESSAGGREGSATAADETSKSAPGEGGGSTAAPPPTSRESSEKRKGREEEEGSSPPSSAAEGGAETESTTTTPPPAVSPPAPPQTILYLTRPPGAFGAGGPPPPIGGMGAIPLSPGGGGRSPPPPGHSHSAAAAVLSVLIPVLSLASRLLLLTILSSSSSGLFGFGGDGGAYSPKPTQHYMFERINDRYRKDGIAMGKALEAAPPGWSARGWGRVLRRRRWYAFLRSRRDAAAAAAAADSSDGIQKKPWWSRSSSDGLYSRTVVLLDLDSVAGDNMDHLRDVTSFLLSQYRHPPTRAAMGERGLEVVLRLESPGGIVQDYGLASNLVARLRDEEGVTLTVCVDRIAASGGYMIASQASPRQLLAAPFALVGSIGVLRESVNVHDVLTKWGVKPLVFKTGEAKNPVGMIGDVTEEGMELVKKDLETIHGAFKDLILDSRTEAFENVTSAEEEEGDREGKMELSTIDRVSTGEVFLGTKARELGLVDRVITSDEYVSERLAAGDRVLKLHKYDRNKFGLNFTPLDLLLLQAPRGGGGGTSGPMGRLRGTVSTVLSSRSAWMPLVKTGGTVGLLNYLQGRSAVRRRRRGI